jgi:hypothetical protein
LRTSNQCRRLDKFHQVPKKVKLDYFDNTDNIILIEKPSKKKIRIFDCQELLLDKEALSLLTVEEKELSIDQGRSKLLGFSCSFFLLLLPLAATRKK